MRPGQRGQASVELLGGIPALLLLGLVVFQALAVGYSAVLAGTAAEAAAISLAGGGDPRSAARAAVPGWSRARMTVAVAADRVEIAMRPPSPIPAVAQKLEVTSEAAVELP